MSVLEIISTGISLIGIGQDVYGWVTGHTLTNQLDGITSQVERLNDQIFLLRNSEMKDISISEQRVISDHQNILTASLPLQQAFNSNLLISHPIVSPSKLKGLFLKNPEDILFGITPLKNQNKPNLPNDPTLVPVTFSKWGQEFIGFIKTGYLKEFLDCEYQPVLTSSSLHTISFNRLPTKNVSDFAFSPENKLVAGSYDGNLYLYDLRTQKISKTMKAGLLGKSPIDTVVFSHKGELIASSGKSASIWNVHAGNKTKSYGLDVWDVSFNHDDSLLAFAMFSGEIILYSFITDKFDVIFKYEPRVLNAGNIAFSPDGRFLASVAYSFVINNRFLMWNIEENKEHYFLSGDIRSVEFSPTGDIFTTTSKNGDVSIFETESGKEILTFASENSDNTRTYSTFSHDGKFIAYTMRDGGAIQLCDVVTGKRAHTIQCPINVSKIAFNPKGYFLAGLTYDKELVLWRLQ